MRRLRLTVFMGALLASAVAVSASAVAPISASQPTKIADGVALGRAHPVLNFKGAIPNIVPLPLARDPLPTACGSDCQEWTLNVATLEPFLVSLRNDLRSTNDGFNLYVFDPNGKQVASAAGIGADGQAVTVNPDLQGAFTVAVTMTYAFDPVPSYHGEVRLMAPGSWTGMQCRGPAPCPILPELKALAPTDLHITGLPPVASTPLGFPLPVDLPTSSSCYADETLRTGAQKCLRFTSEVDNVGFGKLVLRLPWLTTSHGAPTSAFVPTECEAQQVIPYTDGSVRTHDAGPCTFHLQHVHFHYNGFVSFGLYSVDSAGRTGELAAKSLKESFCLADDGYFGFGSAGPNGPRNYAGQPGCNLPSLPNPDAVITMGNSPGWGDIYTWDTPDQFIDITHLAPGIYDLESRANAGRHLLVSSTLHACAATRIKLAVNLGVEKVTVMRKSQPCH